MTTTILTPFDLELRRLHQEMLDEIAVYEALAYHQLPTEEDMTHMGEYFESEKDNYKQSRLPGCSLPSDPE